MTEPLPPVPRDVPPAAPPVRQSADVLVTRHFVRIVAYAVYGSYREDPEAAEFFLPLALEDSALGRHVRAALDASRYIRPGDPDFAVKFRGWKKGDDQRYNQRLLDAAGVRTLKALWGGAGSVQVLRRDGRVTIIPTENLGRGGFGPIAGAEDVVVPASAPDDALGRAVREGLARAR